MSKGARAGLWVYLVVAVLTLIFELYVRLPQCAGTGGCTVSFAKGAVWSAIWPAGWIVYLKGLH